MYVPKHFEMTEHDAFAAMDAHPFATLVTARDERISVSHLPIWVHREERALYGHLARANPHWQLLEGAMDLTLLFTGPHGYISPNWYADPTDVPTWNYLAVAVHGRASLLTSESDARVLLARLSARHEAKFDVPWTLDKMPEAKLTAMIRAIVPFRVDIERIDGKAKLSQNRRPQDIGGAITGLRACAGPSAELMLADAMDVALNASKTTRSAPNDD